MQLKYVRLDGNTALNTWVKLVCDQIRPALKACASAGYRFHADIPYEVRGAFRLLAKTLEGSLRLTEQVSAGRLKISSRLVHDFVSLK